MIKSASSKAPRPGSAAAAVDYARRNGYAGLHVWDDNRGLRDVHIERNRVVLTGA